MATYNTTPINQLPVGLTVKATDIYPAVDTTDHTESPTGTCKQYTVGELAGYLPNSLYSSSNLMTVTSSSTANLTATYYNGLANNGIGATLTNSGAFAALVLDGITLSVGQSVLIKDQTSTFQNGIYTVTTVGDNVSIRWVLTRAVNFDNSKIQITQGQFVGVLDGTTNARTFWFVTSASPVTIGTSPIVFQELTGELSPPYNGFQVFVSQQIGSDVTGTGSETNPFATITHAVTFAGSPPAGSPVIITVIDGNTYDEQVVTNVENLYISMPFAQINFSGVGDALTIGASGKLLIIAASIQNSGTGNAIINNGGSLFAEIGVLQSATVALDQAGPGGLSLIAASQAIQGDITNSGGGNVFYTSNLRIGNDGTGVVGFTPQGCSGNWNVGTSLTFSDTVNGIVGTNSGDNANGGIVGEYSNSNIPFGAAISLVTATPTDLTSITLTAGDWDVTGNVHLNGSANNITDGICYLTLVSATLPDTSEISTVAGSVLLSALGLVAPMQRVNVTINTTIYIDCQANFGAGTVTACGNISARRVR